VKAGPKSAERKAATEYCWTGGEGRPCVPLLVLKVVPRIGVLGTRGGAGLLLKVVLF